MFNWSIALFAALFAVLALTVTPAFGGSHTAIQLAQADDGGGDDDGGDDNGGGGAAGDDDADDNGGIGAAGDDTPTTAAGTTPVQRPFGASRPGLAAPLGSSPL